MPIDGPFFVTPHAVRRYMERIRSVNYERAREELIAISAGAHYVKTRPSGLQVWRGPKPLRLRLVVGRSTRGCPALITVLGGHDQWTKGGT